MAGAGCDRIYLDKGAIATLITFVDFYNSSYDSKKCETIFKELFKCEEIELEKELNYIENYIDSLNKSRTIKNNLVREKIESIITNVICFMLQYNK